MSIVYNYTFPANVPDFIWTQFSCEELKLIDTNLVVKQQQNEHDVISFGAENFCVNFSVKTKYHL